jgi:formylglycine-generating enzyme required for sulfatase activity
LSGPALVRVPAPEGSDEASYCIDATEVTVADYVEFVAAGVSTADQSSQCEWNTSYLPPAGWPPPPGWERYPVTFADFCDARAYCAWAGKRLCGRIGGGPNAFDDFEDPRRSQWFNACSAGGERSYPYGNVYDEGACKKANIEAGGVVPVGSKATCEGAYRGLFDLSGNADEWEDSCRETGGRIDLCRLRGNGDFGYTEVPGFEMGAAEFACSYGGKSGSPETSAGIRCCSD